MLSRDTAARLPASRICRADVDRLLQVTGRRRVNTPGSKTHVGEEGVILPDSRLKRDGIEYGGAVGAGVVTGAIVGGPAGALTGGIIGAGVVTAHLLISHPQATLETGTTLLFTLTERLNLVASNPNGNQPAEASGSLTPGARHPLREPPPVQ